MRAMLAKEPVEDYLSPTGLAMEVHADSSSWPEFINWIIRHGVGSARCTAARSPRHATLDSRGLRMADAGILASKVEKVHLLRPDYLPEEWNPATDKRLTAWEVVHQLIRVLEAGGENAAADLVAQLGSHAETARELAYRLYTLCERKKRAAEALSYNGLVQSWPEISRLARETPQVTPVQTALL